MPHPAAASSAALSLRPSCSSASPAGERCISSAMESPEFTAEFKRRAHRVAHHVNLGPGQLILPHPKR